MGYSQKPGVTGNVAAGGQYDNLTTVDSVSYQNLGAEKAAAAKLSADASALSAAASSSSASTASVSASNTAANAATASTGAATATTQAGIATTKADTATTQASNAASSASTATTGALTATTKAASATSSASTATTQATNSAASATSAASSASTASTQASNASGSATAASSSASTSSTQAGIATAQATTATTQASAATTQAANAATSASTATTQSATATTQASAATTQATTATTQAGIATTGANTATAQAVISTTQAGIATTKATSATSSATTATTQAGIATTNASTATTQAGISTTQAGVATTNANTAIAQANTAATSATTSTSQANIAATQAGIATSQTSLVTTQANDAAVSAGITITQASNAATSASAAATSESNAATSAASVVRNGSGGVAGLTLFKIDLRNVLNTITSFFTNSNTVSRTYTLPDKDGTVAMVSDITGINSGTNTGNQTITLTGGVTGSGSASFAATVVTNANLTGVVTSTGNATVIADSALPIAKTSGLQSALNLKAALASPSFTGSVTVPTPTADTDASNKAYVDSVAQGLAVKEFVRVTTTAALPANTYSNGSSGAGATLTASASGILTVDGIATLINDRILVKDEANASRNGIYMVSTVGTSSVAYVLTRAINTDTAGEFSGAFCFTSSGTLNANSGFVCTTPNPITVGTTGIVFTQFSGAGLIVAGNGLLKSGDTLSIDTAITADVSTAQVLSNKTFVTPALGTPSAVTLTNATGLPYSGLTGTVPTWNQSTTGNAANVNNTVAIAKGGTGSTTASGALTNLGAYASSNPSGYTTNTGTVTSVSGTAPVVSSGGATPSISMAAATTTVSGYLSSTDWNTFNGKQPAGTYATGTGTASGTNTGDQTNIAGNAATATNVAYSGLTGTVPTWNQDTTGTSARTFTPTFSGDSADKGDLTTRTDSGFYQTDSGTNAEGWPVNDTGWQHVIASTHTNDTNYYSMQIGGSFYDNVFYGRKTNGSGTTGWVQFLTSGNYNSYSPTLTGGGASGTWGISIGGNAANTSSISNATGSAFTWTGQQWFQSNLGAYSGALSSPPLQVFSTGGNSAFMSFHRGGSYAVNMGLDSDNVLRIGGWSAAADRWQLDMSGNMTVAGNVTAYSDERLKKDWVDLPKDFISRLAQIKSGTYTRIDSDERQAGSSAQDWQKLLPEVVQTSNDESSTLSLAYGNAALVSAVELAKLTITLIERISKLEDAILKLTEGK
jgi:hypothetical protein